MTEWRDPRLGEPKHAVLPSGTLQYHEKGTGPTIVFVHGYLVNANIWRKVVPQLATHFRCITPDLPLGSHTVPMNRDADLTPRGIAQLIQDLIHARDLHDVILFGNDSGGAYSQVTAAEHPERIGRLILSSCETPQDTWPPSPGGFGLLKATAATSLTYRALYQILRLRSTWRLPNTYGWLAKYPIDRPVMESYIRPVLDSADVRRDGRKAIGSVSAEYVENAAVRLAAGFDKPINLIWAANDHVFPVDNARTYAHDLAAPLRTIPDSYTYVTEDQPESVAALIADCVSPKT